MRIKKQAVPKGAAHRFGVDFLGEYRIVERKFDENFLEKRRGRRRHDDSILKRLLYFPSRPEKRDVLY